MLVLNLLFLIAGALMMAAAIGIPLYGRWMHFAYEYSEAAAVGPALEPRPIAQRAAAAPAIVVRQPLFIEKIVAAHLFGNISLAMMPAGGKFFFANDVFKGFEANTTFRQLMTGSPGPNQHSMR